MTIRFHLKKFILSGLLVVSFIVYAVFSKNSNAPISGANNNPGAGNSVGNKNVVYKDGQYDGSAEDAYYGTLQVAAVISGGKISDVKFLQYANDRQRSDEINQAAMPILKSEAIVAQSAQVDVVSGATFTSQAFIKSLSAALVKAQ